MNKQLFVKPTTVLLSLSLLIISLLLISSCKSKEKQADLTMECRKITKSEIQRNWVDKGWTKDGDPNKIVQIWLSVNKISRQIQIDAIPMKSWDTFIPGGKFKLGRDHTCEVTLGDSVEYVDNWIDFSKLNIIKNPATGELVEFDYIQFMPKVDSMKNVFYSVKVIPLNWDGSSKLIADFDSYPCPPHCPKPPPEETEDVK